ncbi:hypothetical protein DFH27DRAFT_528758 [Peziza echinospora]|nr:hypothetical protein DFH27DRAFT_528758 [Peziza echinospora]
MSQLNSPQPSINDYSPRQGFPESEMNSSPHGQLHNTEFEREYEEEVESSYLPSREITNEPELHLEEEEGGNEAEEGREEDKEEENEEEEIEQAQGFVHQFFEGFDIHDLLDAPSLPVDDHLALAMYLLQWKSHFKACYNPI